MRYGTPTLQSPPGYAQEPPHDFFGIHARCVSRDATEGFLTGDASVVALTWWWCHKEAYIYIGGDPSGMPQPFLQAGRCVPKRGFEFDAAHPCASPDEWPFSATGRDACAQGPSEISKFAIATHLVRLGLCARPRHEREPSEEEVLYL
jgi:hypothetical protein